VGEHGHGRKSHQPLSFLDSRVATTFEKPRFLAIFVGFRDSKA
jgi:hypothetical protein